MDQIEESFRQLNLNQNNLEKGYNIREVLVRNFKSFGEKEQRIGPFIELTSIVGPNGTGKSNIVEALQFIMKDQWSFQDINHNGNGKKVTVKVRLQQGEWKQMKLNEEAKGHWWQNDNQVELCKVAFNNEKIEYFINGRQSEKEEYEDKVSRWMKVTIVNQNMYQELINKKSDELREHIEKVSGSIRFKKDYDKLKKKLGVCEDQHQQLVERQLMVRERKRNAKNSINNRKEYKEVGKELEKLQKQVEVIRFLEIELKLREMERQQKKQEREVQECQEERESVQQEREDIKYQINQQKERERTREHIREQEREKKEMIRGELEGCLNIVEQREKMRVQIQRQIQDIEKEEEQLKTLQERVYETLTLLTSQCKDIQQIEKTLKKDTLFNTLWDEQQSIVLEKGQEQNMQQNKQKQRELRSGLEQKKMEREGYRKEEEDNKRIEIERHELQKERIQMEKEIKRIGDEQGEVEQKIKKQQREMKKLEEQLGEKRKEQERSQEEQEEERMRQELSRLESYKGRVLELYRIQDNERHGPAIRLLLSEHDPTIIIHKQKDLQPVQDILNEYNVRQKVIVLELLNQHNRQTTYNKVRQQLDGSNQILAIDLIEYEKEYMSLMQYLLGETVYITHLDNKLPNIDRQITKEGILLSLRGVTIFNQVKDRHNRKIKQVKDTDILNIRHQYSAIQITYNQYNQTYLELELQKEIYIRQIDSLTQQIDTLCIHVIDKDYTLIDQHILQMEQQINQIAQELQQYQTNINKNIYNTGLFESYKDKTQLQQLIAYKQQPLGYSILLQQQLQEYQEQIEQITIQRESISMKIGSRKKIMIQQQSKIDEEQNRIVKLNQCLEQAQPLDNASGHIDYIAKELQIEKRREKLIDKEQKMRIQLSQLRGEQQRVRNAHYQLYEETQMKRIELDEQLIVSASQKMSDGGIRIQLDYTGMGVNEMLGVDDWQKGVNHEQTNKLQKKLESTIRDKTELFNRHTSAIGQSSSQHQEDKQDILNQLAIRDKTLTNQIETTTKDRRQLENNLSQIDKQRTDMFRNLFTKVQSLVEPIYKQLSSDTASASLFLENSQQPYLAGIVYQTTPPNKRFIFDMSQLSGGEKTLSQLALLTSITVASGQAIVVLDEIDAHLDTNNSVMIMTFFKKWLVQYLGFQVIMVTHQEHLYAESSSLVGVTVQDNTTVAYSLLL